MLIMRVRKGDSCGLVVLCCLSEVMIEIPDRSFVAYCMYRTYTGYGRMHPWWFT